MTEQTEHTLTPYKLNEHGEITGNRDDGCIIALMQSRIYDEKEEQDEMIANAEFIVKACNEHNRLTKERATLIVALEWIVKSESYFNVDGNECINDLGKVALNALAQVKGE